MKKIYFLLLTLVVWQMTVANHLPFIVTDPTMPNLPDLIYCDNNQDGITIFDLTIQNPVILSAQSGAASNYSITYHENLTNAQTGANPVVSPYYNINPFSQTIYARIRNIITNSYAVGSFNLFVNPGPVVNFNVGLSTCDNDSSPYDGSTAVDLSPLLATALNSQPLAASNYTVTFYTSQANAQVGTNPIVPINNYVASNGETIWIGIENNLTGCYGITNSNIIVNAPLNLTTPTPLSVCDDDANPNDQYHSFDLTVKNYEITQGLTGYTVTYFQSFMDAVNNVNPIATPTAYTNFNPAVQTVGVKVTSPAGCVSYTTLDIRVLPIPTPLTNPPTIPGCDNSNGITNDGLAYFDITANVAYIANGDPNAVLHYYATMTDAVSNTNEILNPTAVLLGPNVWIRVENNRIDYYGHYCYVLVEQHLQIVNDAAPTTLQPNYPEYVLCNNSGIPGTETFNLGSRIAAIKLGQLGVDVTFYPSLADAQNGTNGITDLNYVNTSLYVQTLGIRVTNSCSGNYSVSTMDIRVEPLPNTDLISDDTLNTLYVDGSNNVVRPLLLDSQVMGDYSYQWQLNGAPIAGANSSTYIVNTALPGGTDSLFEVTIQDLSTGCTSSDSITVSQSFQVPPPSGAVSQTYSPGGTLAYLTVSGSNILWYALASGKNTTSTPLPLSTALVDGTTYYASQTIGGTESAGRLPVTVHQALGVPTNELFSLRYAPNPVKDLLNLESNTILTSVLVYNLLGQEVFEQSFNDTHVLVDLSDLKTGNYIVKVQCETTQKVIKILKQ